MGFPHAADRPVQTALRGENKRAFWVHCSMLEQLVDLIGHRDLSTRRFRLSEWIENRARAEIKILKANAKCFLRPQSCVEHDLRDVFQRLSRFCEVCDFLFEAHHARPSVALGKIRNTLCRV